MWWRRDWGASLGYTGNGLFVQIVMGVGDVLAAVARGSGVAGMGVHAAAWSEYEVRTDSIGIDSVWKPGWVSGRQPARLHAAELTPFPPLFLWAGYRRSAPVMSRRATILHDMALFASIFFVMFAPGSGTTPKHALVYRRVPASARSRSRPSARPRMLALIALWHPERSPSPLRCVRSCLRVLERSEAKEFAKGSQVFRHGACGHVQRSPPCAPCGHPLVDGYWASWRHGFAQRPCGRTAIVDGGRGMGGEANA